MFIMGDDHAAGFGIANSWKNCGSTLLQPFQSLVDVDTLQFSEIDGEDFALGASNSSVEVSLCGEPVCAS
jgi:hypothetical protein